MKNIYVKFTIGFWKSRNLVDSFFFSFFPFPLFLFWCSSLSFFIYASHCGFRSRFLFVLGNFSSVAWLFFKQCWQSKRGRIGRLYMERLFCKLSICYSFRRFYHLAQTRFPFGACFTFGTSGHKCIKIYMDSQQ